MTQLSTNNIFKFNIQKGLNISKSLLSPLKQIKRFIINKSKSRNSIIVAIKLIINPPTNLLDRLISSLILLRHIYNVSYKSNITISSVINYNSNTKSDLSYITTRLELSNLEISDYKNLRSRKKRKLNSTIITYYYYYLDYSSNIL